MRPSYVSDSLPSVPDSKPDASPYRAAIQFPSACSLSFRPAAPVRRSRSSGRPASAQPSPGRRHQASVRNRRRRGDRADHRTNYVSCFVARHVQPHPDVVASSVSEGVCHEGRSIGRCGRDTEPRAQRPQIADPVEGVGQPLLRSTLVVPTRYHRPLARKRFSGWTSRGSPR